MRVLMTAFGPFADYDQNPSEMVLEYARRHCDFGDCVVEWAVLPVVFEAVDSFITGLQSSTYDVLIHTGVAVGSMQPQIELCARNQVKGSDTNGIARNGVIEANGPALLQSPMANHILNLCETSDLAIETSKDAGAYLCNYIYYKSLRCLGQQTGVVFIHLADFMSNPNARSLESQAVLLLKLLDFVRELDFT